MKKTPSWADDRAFGRSTTYSSERAQKTVDVSWIRNSDGNWYLLDELPRILPSMQCDGIYIIWYFDESHAPQTVRVGMKGVNDHLRMMCKDPEIEKYAEHPLYITWARVKSSSLDYLQGIWSYLCKELEPFVGPRCPQVDATRVVLPWVPIKEASGASESTPQQQKAPKERTPTSGTNPQQQVAIHTTEGPLLIIAGPGSGKTFTLVERVYHLISEHEIPPERIFVSTFTEKAAAELITRVSSRLAADNISVNLNEMYIGTFHSICLRFLEENRDATRLKRSFTLLDQFDQQYFLYQHLSDYQEIEGSEHIINGWGWRGAANLMAWVNKVSEEALDPEVLLNASDPEVQALGRCYQQYQTHLEEENYLDFSTIQIEALRLLNGHPEILDDIREKIQYLMVDEYQDTNTIQERILFKLAEPDFNLCVVGDDDQGLYRFRGATIRNILEFPQQFPVGACQQVRLTTNYRSHPDIIEFYNKWMETLDWTADGKTFRYEKEIVPDAETDFTDMPAALKIAGHNTENWHEEVLAFLYRLRDRGALEDWNQVAFLFWSVKHPKAVALAEALEADGIPVYSPRSNQFFDRREIRLIIGALIFLFPQFPEVRQWREGVWLDIWDYYDEECVREFVTMNSADQKISHCWRGAAGKQKSIAR